MRRGDWESWPNSVNPVLEIPGEILADACYGLPTSQGEGMSTRRSAEAVVGAKALKGRI